MVFGRLFSPILIQFPQPIRELAFYNTNDWSFHDQGPLHDDLGSVVTHVSPGTALCDYILSRRKEFIKPVSLLASINLFGKTVASVEGAEWQRQRRITAPPFNECNSALVWQESCRQADQMLETWTEHEMKPINSVDSDAARLTLNIITCAGFGQSYQFRSTGDKMEENHSMSYGASLMTVMANIALLVLIPSGSVSEYKSYMVHMVNSAEQEATKGESLHPNHLNTLVQTSETIKSTNMAGEGLTDDEIHGNLFIFSFAGHETTANTLTYSIYLLAAFPKWQDWISEEVCAVFGPNVDENAFKYEDVYTKLNRCLATMQETLRLFPPVMKIPKSTGSFPQQITVEGRKAVIPAGTHIFPNIIGLHSSSKYWGANSHLWRPDRWIEHPSPGSRALADEAIKAPVKGSYVPWAEGPRICPGKKFSQVEYVSVIARLLRSHKINVVKNSTEIEEQARKRALFAVKNSDVKITLQMKNSGSVQLRFVRRGT